MSEPRAAIAAARSSSSPHGRCLVAWLALVATATPAPGAAAESSTVEPVRFDGDVRDLPVAGPWPSGGPVLELERRQTAQLPSSAGPPPSPLERDPLLALQEAFSPAGTLRALLPPTVNVEGIGFDRALPPDTVGDVGPDHYIQLVNGRIGSLFSIYDKAGNRLAGPTLLELLGPPGFPDFCDFQNGDPIVLYDRAAERWLMMELAQVTILGLFISHLCIYVSQTSDPVGGGWLRYAVFTPFFPDYPKLAVWPDAYYVTTNEPFSSPIYALERSAMLAGEPARAQRVTTPRLPGFPFQALTPADLDGAHPPPAGSPAYFIRHRDDESHDFPPDPSRDFLELFEYRVDFSDPAGSELTGPIFIPVAEFDSNLCGLSSLECIPQPLTSQRLDPLREVVMWRLQYRNFETHETLVGNFTVDVDDTDHGGIRWFELRKTGAGGWETFQEGSFAPNALHRWMGSIAMDGEGNIALGYSASAAHVGPSIRVTGRRAGGPPGVMTEPERNIVQGGSQTGSSRWGDYSAMSVDPVDDCTFWYTNEYLPRTAAFDWSTRILRFRFRSCGNLPPVPVVEAVTPVECDGEQSGSVVLDASTSTDPDSLPGTNDDIVLFEWFEKSGPDDLVALGEGEVLEATLPLGLTRVTLRLTDSEGHRATAELEIEVVDTEPPELAVELSPSTLWPPNHRLVAITADVVARDNCGPVEVVLESVTSSDSDDDDGQADIQGVDVGTFDLAFEVRVERSGHEQLGRIYTATYRAVDSSENATRASAVIVVPHSRSGDALELGLDPGVASLTDESGAVFAFAGRTPGGGYLFLRAAPVAIPAASPTARAALALLLAAAGASRWRRASANL